MPMEWMSVCLCVCPDYLDNHSSDHTWRVHCWRPKEGQCWMWCNLARWWRYDTKLYILGCNFWTLSLRNKIPLDSMGPNESIHVSHSHLDRFSTILNFVHICFFATPPAKFEQSSPDFVQNISGPIKKKFFIAKQSTDSKQARFEWALH